MADGNTEDNASIACAELTSERMAPIAAQPSRKRPFRCPACPRSFKTADDLANHTKTIHKAKRWGVCAYCGFPRFLTRDHILPKHLVASSLFPTGTRNVRRVCRPCNELRATARDCPAVLAMARFMTAECSLSIRDVLVAWGYFGRPKAQTEAQLHLAKVAANRRGRALTDALAPSSKE